MAWLAVSALVVLTVAASAPAAARLFTYRDDFETDKLRRDSVSHSQFDASWIPEDKPPLLLYVDFAPPSIPAQSDRGLVFSAGSARFGVDRWAEVTYQPLPQGAVATGGLLEFDQLPTPDPLVRFDVLGSSGGTTWFEIPPATPLGASHAMYAFPPGTPAEFIRLRGNGAIDNLAISISYVPEPAGMLSVIAVSAGLWRRPGRRPSRT